MRDVKDKYTPLVCTFLRPSCLHKTRLTNESCDVCMRDVKKKHTAAVTCVMSVPLD